MIAHVDSIRSPKLSTKRKVIFGATFSLGILALLELSASVLLKETLAEREAEPLSREDWAPTMRGNPYLLWEYAPGQRTEQGTDVNINSLGLRGSEPVRPKPNSVRRIITTGDSSVYGFMVGEGDVFIDVVQQRLASIDPNIETWNCAIPGYSTYQSLNLLEMRALTLEPDIIVIANIWSDNNFDTFVDRELLSTYQNYEGGLSGVITSLFGWSHIYKAADYLVRVKGGDEALAREVGWEVGGQDATSGQRRVSVNDYAANLQRMVDVSEANSAIPVFAMLPHPTDLMPSSEPPAWDLYREVMRDTAERNGALLVDLREPFAASGLTHDELFFEEGEPGIRGNLHPTVVGHRLMGEAIADALAGWASSGEIQYSPFDSPIPIYEDPFVFEDGDPSKTPEIGNSGDVVFSGEVLLENFSGVSLQVDAIVPNSFPPQRLHGARLNEPGPFRMSLPPGTESVTLMIYEDITGDGPTSDDRRYDWSDRMVVLNGSNVIIDLNTED